MVARHSPRSVLIQLVAAAGGSILYALSICLTSILAIPGADNVQLRPGVVVPIVVGALFGPAAGFTSGCAGNLAADQLLGWGWWPFWYFGNGMIGLAAGMFRPASGGANYTQLRPVIGVLLRALLGIGIGMGIASLSERWVTNSSWADVVQVNFLPAFLSNTATATILTPVVLLIYGILRESTSLDPGEP